MLNKNDFKYILKRVLTFLTIGAILCLLGSCKAKASTGYITPYNATIHFSDTSAVLTNYNFDNVYPLEDSNPLVVMRELLNYNYSYSRLDYFNFGLISGQPFSEPETYYNFDLSLSGSGVFNSNGSPFLDFDYIKSNDRINGNWFNCDITGKEIHYNTTIPSDSYILANVRCLSPNTNGFDIRLKKYNPNDNSNPTLNLNLGISVNIFYTTDIDSPEMMEEILDLKQELIKNQMYQQMQDIDVNEFNSKYSEVANSSNIQNNTISQLILLPIQLLNAYKTSWNSNTCIPVNLGSLYGTNLVLPCINISNYLGSTLWNTIDYLMSGFLILTIAKKFVNVFDDLTNLRTNQADELYGGGA